MSDSSDNSPRFVALIPLRAGSASISGKNVRPLAGRPLCDWAIRAALDSGIFDSVWVSTDSDEIEQIARMAGAQVHRRAPETATETASSESAMFDFAAAHPEFDVLALVQATSPLTRPEDFLGARATFLAEGADSLVTVTRQRRFRWSATADGAEALNYDPAARPRRQDWEGELIENGAFYFTRKALLEGAKCRLGGRVCVYEMPAHTSFEVDEPEDWTILEALARRHGYTPPGKPIRLLALDVDGVLNDSGFYYDERGERLKRFSTRDGEGIARLMRVGVEVGLITGESTGFTPARARKLGIDRLELGCSDKLPVLDGWRRELGLEWDEVAYMGDDLADLECVRAAGLGACPIDAEAAVREAARFISLRPGGNGAVRDLSNYIFDTGRCPAPGPKADAADADADSEKNKSTP